MTKSKKIFTGVVVVFFLIMILIFIDMAKKTTFPKPGKKKATDSVQLTN